MFAQISQRICWLELVLWVAKQPSFLRMDDRLLHMSMCRLIWLVARRTSSIVGNAIPRLIFYMRQQKAKLTIKLVWSAKTQISLYIRPVWQGFSFIPLLFIPLWRQILSFYSRDLFRRYSGCRETNKKLSSWWKMENVQSIPSDLNIMAMLWPTTNWSANDKCQLCHMVATYN